MRDAQTDKVAQWMAEGLALFATGDRAGAAACWKKVLEVEPDHQVARDYLGTIGGGEVAPGPTTTEEIVEHGVVDAAEANLGGDLAGEIREEAMDLAQGGMIDEAYDLMTSTISEGPSDPDSLALLELLRMHLHEDVLRRLGSSASVPVVEMSPEDLMKFNLPAGAGFLISRIDGATSVDDLVAVSGMDPFETMHTLGRLLDAGIVGVTS